MPILDPINITVVRTSLGGKTSRHRQSGQMQCHVVVLDLHILRYQLPRCVETEKKKTRKHVKQKNMKIKFLFSFQTPVRSGPVRSGPVPRSLLLLALEPLRLAVLGLVSPGLAVVHQRLPKRRPPAESQSNGCTHCCCYCCCCRCIPAALLSCCGDMNISCCKQVPDTYILPRY